MNVASYASICKLNMFKLTTFETILLKRNQAFKNLEFDLLLVCSQYMVMGSEFICLDFIICLNNNCVHTEDAVLFPTAANNTENTRSFTCLASPSWGLVKERASRQWLRSSEMDIFMSPVTRLEKPCFSMILHIFFRMFWCWNSERWVAARGLWSARQILRATWAVLSSSSCWILSK